MKYADSTNQHTAKIRSGRLLAAYLKRDASEACDVTAELGDDNERWARVAVELAARHWVEITRRFGVGPQDEGSEIGDADTYLDNEIEAIDQPVWGLALRLTRAISDPDEHDAIDGLLREVEDYPALVDALAQLVIAQRQEQARADLLGDVYTFLYRVTGELPAAPCDGEQE